MKVVDEFHNTKILSNTYHTDTEMPSTTFVIFCKQRSTYLQRKYIEMLHIVKISDCVVGCSEVPNKRVTYLIILDKFFPASTFHHLHKRKNVPPTRLLRTYTFIRVLRVVGDIAAILVSWWIDLVVGDEPLWNREAGVREAVKAAATSFPFTDTSSSNSLMS